jgi:hypothetical protein
MIGEYTIFYPEQINPNELGHELTNNKESHPKVVRFLNMSQEEKIARYANSHPNTNIQTLTKILSSEVEHLRWSGSDLLNVFDTSGKKHKYLLETNSCPSGALDLPTRTQEHTGKTPYEMILEGTLIPQIKEEGDLAVIWDKNRRGTRAYAKTLASLTGRPVHHIPLLDSSEFRFPKSEYLTFNDRKLAGVFRYVTQLPWERLAIDTATPMVNPIIGCIAGGRNKLIAAKAYQEFNDAFEGVKINVPYTTSELTREETLETLKEWGNIAVIKDPYSNAGQGVYTITNQKELEEFKKISNPEGIYIVQQLIGNQEFTSNGRLNPLVHVGSNPIDGNNYAIDIRMMVINSTEGYKPVSLYGRRARAPLESRVSENTSSWDILGTNLSVKLGEDKWRYDEEERQLVVTPEDFPKLNIGVDDLIDIYVQACFSNYAINDMANKLMPKGQFNREIFKKLNNDPAFNDSILQTQRIY